METTCPLCRMRVPPTHQCWCVCGQAMDPRCFDSHEPWCSVRGTDAWIGAVEF